MRPDVAASKSWTDALLPRVKQIIGLHLITEAPFKEDARHNTDLIVLTLEAKRIAVRLRHAEYLARYGDQFTIRVSRPSGIETELSKVISGWGNYLFYGFEHAGNPFDLAAWLLGDLNVFRLWHSRALAVGQKPWIPKQNGDGSSDFHAYRISDLPPEFIIARYPKTG